MQNHLIQKTTTETTDTKDSEDSEKDSTDTDTKETDSSGENRLVSVKDVSKYVTIGEYKGLELTLYFTASYRR